MVLRTGLSALSDIFLLFTNTQPHASLYQPPLTCPQTPYAHTIHPPTHPPNLTTTPTQLSTHPPTHLPTTYLPAMHAHTLHAHAHTPTHTHTHTHTHTQTTTTALANTITANSPHQPLRVRSTSVASEASKVTLLHWLRQDARNVYAWYPRGFWRIVGRRSSADTICSSTPLLSTASPRIM